MIYPLSLFLNKFLGLLKHAEGSRVRGRILKKKRPLRAIIRHIVKKFGSPGSYGLRDLGVHTDISGIYRSICFPWHT